MFLSTARLRSVFSVAVCPTLRRTLFSLPDLPKLPFGPESKSQTYNEEKLFPYNEEELYAVVADVASYPQFIPFCVGSRIDNSAFRQAMKDKTVSEAELTVGFLSFKESYVSTVTCIPFKSVQAQASSSTPLFKTLSTTWKFQRTASRLSLSTNSIAGRNPDSHSGPTLVTFDLTYEFANPIHAGISATFFGQVSKLMVKAFEDRCSTVYGPRSLS
ncbi:hypothetical protein GALMADRAFT_236144 [Galerina marginata CBS 339.88]|uniref:Coenzyme Q-binding protein COQ10 START domain-containing protein n=1 Tax=Galerina marginata (strain CBS 339.88) TaxID=685588 RepID=A0A067TKT7_GALM3|nr:hypothetical protein GALMADRAFT_236144 [Galerina marginata CBS 339.88]